MMVSISLKLRFWSRTSFIPRKLRISFSRSAAKAKQAWMSSDASSGKSFKTCWSDLSAARYSETSRTVIRIPRMHSLPLRLPGSIVMILEQSRVPGGFSDAEVARLLAPRWSLGLGPWLPKCGADPPIQYSRLGRHVRRRCESGLLHLGVLWDCERRCWRGGVGIGVRGPLCSGWKSHARDEPHRRETLCIERSESLA